MKVTERRAAEDFAQCMRELVDVHFPKAEKIRVVLDNLSTHSAAALYQSLPPEDARRVLRRLEFHYTPKHGKRRSGTTGRGKLLARSDQAVMATFCVA